MGALKVIKMAAVPTCRNATCSKGKRWLARPTKITWKVKQIAQPIVRMSPMCYLGEVGQSCAAAGYRHQKQPDQREHDSRYAP